MGDEALDVARVPVPCVRGFAFLSHVYEGLAVTADEAEAPRLWPSRLVVRTGVLSLLGAQGPYSQLQRVLGAAAIDPSAVASFPYDWRLSNEYNAGQLSAFADAHLERWKKSLKALVVDADGPLHRLDVDSVRLCFVAHSMGGLVARRASAGRTLVGKVRKVVSLGTPYWGSAKTVGVLSKGKAASYLDERAAQRLAVTCPGVYDLLPREPCILRRGRWEPLLPSDVEAMGGSDELATEAWERWRAIDPSHTVEGLETIPIAGFTLPTARTVRVDERGEWIPEAVDWQGYLATGDGTVAHLEPPTDSVAQLQVESHEGLPESPTVIQAVIRHLLGIPGPPVTLAPPRELGLSAPTTTGPGRVVVHVNEMGEAKPKTTGIRVTSVTETAEGRWSSSKGWTFDGVRDGELLFSRSLAPGIHRINVSGGGSRGVWCTTAVVTNE